MVSSTYSILCSLLYSSQVFICYQLVNDSAEITNRFLTQPIKLLNKFLTKQDIIITIQGLIGSSPKVLLFFTIAFLKRNKLHSLLARCLN